MHNPSGVTNLMASSSHCAKKTVISKDSCVTSNPTVLIRALAPRRGSEQDGTDKISDKLPYSAQERIVGVVALAKAQGPLCGETELGQYPVPPGPLSIGAECPRKKFAPTTYAGRKRAYPVPTQQPGHVAKIIHYGEAPKIIYGIAISAWGCGTSILVAVEHGFGLWGRRASLVDTEPRPDSTPWSRRLVPSTHSASPSSRPLYPIARLRIFQRGRNSGLQGITHLLYRNVDNPWPRARDNSPRQLQQGNTATAMRYDSITSAAAGGPLQAAADTCDRTGRTA
ncbi:hypothetical protein C8Q79DRAFT_924975 [Trametes meyenii]|nr:hypothetical protein C8Q79DRAFT_924975 [Trametes meyenii]